MKKDNVLVIGASGIIGSEVVRILQSQGYQVRSTTSKKATKDGSVYLNLVTGEGTKEAFQGMDRVFMLSPSGFGDQYKILAPLIQEAKRQAVKKVVLMTAMGANAADANPMRKAEIELEKSGLSYNIVRPNWFMQNFNTFWIQGINEQGKIFLPAGKASTSFIDTKDISAVIAKLLINDTLNNRDFDLTGSVALTHDEVAAQIAQATGRDIGYQEITPEAFRDGLLSAGIPADYTELLVTIIGFLKEGYNTRTTENVEMILGHSPRSFQDYVEENKKSWLV